MHHMLTQIIAEKQEEIKRLKDGVSRMPPRESSMPLRDFRSGISRPGGINLIGEIKFASPSAGEIREKAEASFLGQNYERAGASALSLITDREFFQGDLEQMPLLKGSVSLPILRKDFILDEIQVQESFESGADALLLIARILSAEGLKELLHRTRQLGMAALTEIHDRDDLEKALACGADIIGINNRNLDTFEVDIRTTLELAPLVPSGHILVSESGIRGPGDVRMLLGTGVRAVLVGTAIMESRDMVSEAGDLVEAGKRRNGKG